MIISLISRPLLLVLLVLLPPNVPQSGPRQQTSGERLRELRIYLIDRVNPARSWKDAIASLTIERRTGTGTTILLPRVSRAEKSDDGRVAEGQIRTLIGTHYFVELSMGQLDTSLDQRKHLQELQPSPDSDSRQDRKDHQAPSSEEILRIVHRGPCFVRNVPESTLAEPFTATVTIRIGSQSLTSEEFQSPQEAHTGYDEVAARVGESLELVTNRSREGASFMDLRPAVVELIRGLSQLAPAGFEDTSGTVERNRQWCLALARGMENALYDGNTGSIVNLCLECGPRIREMHSFLKRSRPPEQPPVTETPPAK